MKNSLKGMALGLAMMAGCAAILLISDWDRRTVPARSLPVVCVFQFASRDVLDASVAGCLDALAGRGYEDGRAIKIRRYNAESDFAAANAIAKAITEGGGKMVITFSTPALQIMAGANREGRIIHLFGTVTDPFASGVGLSRDNPEDRPAHLAGIGTFQPVKEVWRMAKAVNPGLKTVGAVWCTSETCSEACTRLAREVAKELGVQFLESPVSSSTEIPDAVRSLLARGIDALWIGGDNIVEMAAPAVIETALEAGIPTFANAPQHAENGALLALGADYYQVGRVVGGLAADVLEGRQPKDIPVDNIVPPLLYINTNILARLKQPGAWTPKPEFLASAARVIGAASAGGAEAARPVASVKKRVGIFYYGPDPMVERGVQGFTNGLNELAGQYKFDIHYVVRHAQSDFSQIPQIVRQMDEEGVDILAPMTTPCLAAALGLVRKTPVVFALVYDPIAAGAGMDFTNHHENTTGIGCFPPLEDTMDFIQRLMPSLKKLGTVYNPSEANSSKAVQIGGDILKRRGIVLDTASAPSASEIYAAALAVVQRGAEAIWITGDNTVLAGFAAVAGVARNAKLAVICNDIEMLEHGATAAVGLDSYEAGYAAAEPAAMVLKGEKPAGIPIRNVSIRRTALNPALARELGMRLDDGILADADILAGPPPKRMRIALLEQVETAAVEETRLGLMDGLKAEGLSENQDFTVRRLNAQGEISMLDSLVDAALAEQADIIAAITTPALQTAMRKVKDRPIIFALALDPLLIGDDGTHERHQPNVTGVFDTSPFEAMVELIRECLPNTRRIGTLFAPSEVNSTVFRDYFERAARDRGLELMALPANSPTETGPAAQALIQKGIDVLCQINDNQNNAAFPAIVEAARAARIPLFAFSSGLAEQGAAVALSNDHYEGGREAGALMARVMRGQSPASLPYRPIRRTRLAVNLDAARGAVLELPAAVVKRADKALGAQKPAASENGKTSKPAAPAALSPMRHMRMINYVDGTYVAEVIKGVKAGLQDKGWKEGVDYRLTIGNAQGDIAALAGLVAAAIDEKPDVLLITSTPALQAAIQRAPAGQPIIFGAVGAPLAAGAGNSNSEHLPNVTGISTESDFAGMVRVIKKCFPDARAVGTLFTPSEVNSVFYKDRFEEELKKEGISLITRPVASAADIADAALALSQSDISAICQISDNLNDSGFSAITHAARRQRLPLFAFLSGHVIRNGAILAVSRDYEQVGKDMIELVSMLFQGQSLAHIPLRPVSKTLLIVNPNNLEYCRLNIPAEILDSAIIVKE